VSFDLERILATLQRHRVAYVLIGGIAATAHGSVLPTEDVDITPARDRNNLDRLARALRELNARIRTDNEPDGVEFACDGDFLAAQPLMLNLTTEAGDLDLALFPAGFPDGFDGLADRALEVEFGDGVPALVASLDDVIASKRAAGRVKDQAALPYLEALADEIARGF
jgi:hypothetical protein